MRAPLNGPNTTPRRWSALVGLLAVTALLLAGCGSDDGDDESTSADPTTTESTAPTPTEAETTTSTTEAPSSETTASTPDDGGDDETTTTAEPTEAPLSPGDPCSIEEGDPDCIDPDGDGEGVYLEGGADCAANAPDISICEDLDGDGVAGYPDEYEDLPTCSAEVPPPCNNPPGSSDDE